MRTTQAGARAAGGHGYHEVLRGAPRSGWGWSLLGVASYAALMVVVVPVALVGVFMLGFLLAGEPVRESITRVVDTETVVPSGLFFLNLSLAAAIPVAWFVVRVVHGLRPRWLSSVVPRLRWRWMGVCFGLSVLALLATVLVSSVVPQQGTGLAGEPNAFTSTTRDFLLVVVLLTPLQAAGEEYAFRGYLTQAFGGLFRSRVPAVLVPAFLFALAHGAQDPPIFVDRLAFGIVAGILVIATGGLEAAIAMHVLNNWLAFGLALAYGDMSSALNPTGGTWWSLPVTLTQSLVYLVLAVLVARRLGVRTTIDEAVLEPVGPRV